MAKTTSKSTKKTKTVPYDLAEQLRTAEEMAAYLDAWLAEDPPFEPDRWRERFLLTQNPRGYLRRIGVIGLADTSGYRLRPASLARLGPVRPRTHAAARAVT